MSEESPEQINFEEELHRYKWAEPFNPFEIVLTSGDRYEVVNPDQLAFGGNTVVVMKPKTGIQFFRKNQIVAVHVREAETDIRLELTRRLSAKPFQPFEIVTVDGQRHPIVRTFQAAVGQSIVLVAPPEGDGAKRIPIDTIQSLPPV